MHIINVTVADGAGLNVLVPKTNPDQFKIASGAAMLFWLKVRRQFVWHTQTV